MRILIVSKFFYPRGGACVVAMGTRELLLEAGHQVRVFAMRYPLNIDLPDCAFYTSQISFDGSLSSKFKAFQRLLGWGDVAKDFKKVIDDFKPDVIHAHNIHSYLSPIVCEIAHNAKIPVVWTLHDFKLICPAYTFRKNDGSICDLATSECHVFRNKCHKGSYIASAMAYIEARRWSINKLNDITDAYIAPSQFMSNIMKQNGATPDKMHVIYNFIDPAKLKLLNRRNHNEKNKHHFFAYTGRLSEEKGVGTLIEAAIRANVNLKIAGDGPIRDELERLASGYKGIVFLGKLNAEDVARLQCEADACICPSEWYENNPLAVIESLCAGTPVIGANIGGIPELISHGNNGLLFEHGNVEDLADKLRNFDCNLFHNNVIAAEAVKNFSTDEHISRVLSVYNRCIEQSINPKK